MRVKVAGLQAENAQMRATLAELNAKVSELTFVSERLRVENKGPPGTRGERGRDGRDGPRGETGLQGEKGERGAPAPLVVGWDVAADDYAITPLMSDGSRGPMLHVRGIFETYDASADAANAAEQADADAVERAHVEREAANVRAGLPAR